MGVSHYFLNFLNKLPKSSIISPSLSASNNCLAIENKFPPPNCCKLLVVVDARVATPVASKFCAFFWLPNAPKEKEGSGLHI